MWVASFPGSLDSMMTEGLVYFVTSLCEDMTQCHSRFLYRIHRAHLIPYMVGLHMRLRRLRYGNETNGIKTSV